MSWIERGEVLGHGPAKIGDGATSDLPSLKVGGVGSSGRANGLALDLGVGLGHAEDIGAKLFSAHVVENMLAAGESFAGGDERYTGASTKAETGHRARA